MSDSKARSISVKNLISQFFVLTNDVILKTQRKKKFGSSSGNECLTSPQILARNTIFDVIDHLVAKTTKKVGNSSPIRINVKVCT